MYILVYGAGSLGSLIGGLLASEHNVTLLAREAHVEAIKAEGLKITGEIERTVFPAAVTALEDADSPDLAIITVKAYDTESATRDLARTDIETVLSLQNGMGNEETLEEYLETSVLAGTTTFGAHLRDPGVVGCTGVGSVTIGPYGDTSQTVTTRVGDGFRAAGIETEVVCDPDPLLWEKLAVNAGINPVTALARVRNGAILEGETADIAVQAALETAMVARTQGVVVSDSRVRDAVQSVVAATAENRSSMLADVKGGQRTEIDAINGYVIAQADQEVPINQTLATLIRAWEAGEGLR